MAENKKSFVLYADLIHTVRHLSKEDAGELFMHILSYVSDENPVTENPIVKISFEPVKQQLKRDLIKWEEIKVKRSDAGKISAEKKKQQSATKSTHVESVEQTSTKSTVSVNDNVNVTVIDIWKNSYEYLKQDGVWFEQEVVMKFKIPTQDLNNRLEQYWLSLQKSNFKGELKQIRAGAIKWLKTWSDRDSKPIGGKREVVTKKYERL